MVVIKLGGSLYNSPELTAWLQALVSYSEQTPVVIVPGGGPFADQVRVAQSQHTLSDATAHHMAIIAMKQFGLLLADLEPCCQLVHGHKPANSPISIWLPDDDLLAESNLPHNWTITSDCIALWLASKLNAEHLLLIKHSKNDTSSIHQLISNHIIDSGFADLFAEKPIDSKIVHYQSYSDLNAVQLLPSLSLP